MAKSRAQRGVTLIELLVALALVSVVLAAAGNMMLQAYANEATYREQNIAQQNARTASDMIADDMRGAAKVNVTMTYTISGVSYTETLPKDTVVYGGNGGTGTVGGSAAIAITDYTKPLAFSIYDNTGTKKSVYYWLNTGTKQIYRKFSAAPTSVTDGTPIANFITTFTVARPLAASTTNPSTNDYNLVRLNITATAGTNPTSTVTLQNDVMLRNNLL